jgi:MFS family permease
VVRNVVQSLSSFPVGVLADRVGPLPVLAVGYTLGATTALLVAAAFAWQITTFSSLVLLFVIAGVYMAVQESLESTVVAELVTRETLGTSLGALGTVNGVAKFLASTLVGVVWSTLSPVAAFGLAAGLMGAGTVLLTRLPRRP